MPRLSIIVPHRQDDQQLEATILSVLENRPRDCEVIVVHDGSYLDPYQLSDELIYVQEEQGASLTELLADPELARNALPAPRQAPEDPFEHVPAIDECGVLDLPPLPAPWCSEDDGWE